MELNPTPALRPYETAPASSIRPESTFGGACHTDARRATAGCEPGNALRLHLQPWHRHAINYLALQMDPRQVAAACDVHVNTIYVLMKTPWFSEMLDVAVKESKKDLIALVDANSLAAMTTMVEIMHDTKIAPATRLASAKSLLEWKLGKPTQRVETVSAKVESLDPVAEAAELERIERENAQLRAG